MEKNQEIERVYVDVTAFFSKEGIIRPLSFIWEDGHRYEIDRINNIERGSGRKNGESGLLYTCMIKGRPSHLFYEEHNRWFMERNLPD